MAKQIHYDIEPLVISFPEAFYYLIFGQKSNGKSYQAKQSPGAFFGVTHYLETGMKFVLTRRWGTDLTSSWIEKYFSDVDVKKLTNGKYTFISVWRKDIFFSNIDENYKVKRGEKIGTAVALSMEQHYSGASFLEYDNIIFEEFMERGAWLKDESEKLQILYSTVDRKRGITKVVMVGNTITRICPYLVDWNLLDTVRNLKQGEKALVDTGTTYELEDGTIKPVTIALEFCRDSGGKSLAFGSAKKMIDEGDWQSKPQPKLTNSKNEYKIMYRIGFEYKGFRFLGELMRKDKDLMWFIYPKNDDFDNKIIVFSDRVVESRLWFRDIYSARVPNRLKKILDTFRESIIFYSDDLTGTDFKQAIDFEIRK